VPRLLRVAIAPIAPVTNVTAAKPSQASSVFVREFMRAGECICRAGCRESVRLLDPGRRSSSFSRGFSRPSMDHPSRNDILPEAPSELDLARRRFDERAWEQAFSHYWNALRASGEGRAPELDDLERAATSAALTGRDREFLALLEQTHSAALAAGASRRAAWAALSSVMRLMALGEQGRASGWFARLRRLAEAAGADSLEHCYLQVPLAFAALSRADFGEAERVATAASVLADRLADADMQAFTRSLAGRALLRQSKLESGLVFLDECMLSVTAGGVSPVIVALAYCTVIASLHEVYAFERASEWTRALAEWCDAQPELVAFRGICLVHRAEIARMSGDWPRAAEQATRASAGIPGHQNPDSVGDAYYELGELYRLRGELSAAERAYADAARHGREPHPGIALLRAARGQHADAVSGLKRALTEASAPLVRAKLLPAAVEILVAGGDLEAASAACQELERIAAALGTEALGALAAHARATLLLHAGEAQAALGPLRHAFFIWQRIGAPHAAAKVRVDLARACDALGDGAGAALERAAAHAVFAELGAALDLAALAGRAATGTDTRGLTERELQVLRLVAAGGSNKSIANELGLSEKTVDRHVSNIFGKLNVSSRAAATAYAYEHGLIAR
jgi:DNA-binding CsgD family transcriptional regulator